MPKPPSGSLFGAESERFWHDAIDGTLLTGAFRVLPIDYHLAKLCTIDSSRGGGIKNAVGHPKRFTERR